MYSIWKLIKATVAEWQDDNANRLAAALSYYSAISIAPLLVLALTIAGFVYDTESAREQLITQLQGFMGEQSVGIVESVLKNADQPQVATFAGALSLLVLLWGASNVFAQLQDAMNTIWNVELKPSAGIWMTIRERLLSFGMVLGIGFLLIVSLILSAALSVMSAQFSSVLPGVDWLWQLLEQVISFVVIAALFAVIYKVLPDAVITWRDVLWGAVVTALLFTIGKYALSIYLGMQSASSAYGAAGSLVVFLIWVYFSAQIFFFGAEFTQVYARRYGSGIRPTENAVYSDSS